MKKIWCLLYAVILFMRPLRVFAMEATDEDINVKILTSEEAERLYFELIS